MTVVAGARRTITYQVFDVNVHDDAEGDKVLIVMEPDRTAHVFALNEEGRRTLLAGLERVATAGPADVARAAREAGR